MPHLQVFDESEAENYSTSGHCKLRQSLSLIIDKKFWFKT